MRVLIVKLSSLGDVVHSLPVVADLHALRPEVQVDWLVEEGYADLLAQVRGITRVLPVALRRWRQHPWRYTQEWLACWRQLRAAPYDLVLDLQGLSKSALLACASRLCAQGERVGMLEATDGSSFEAPARWLMHRGVPLPRRVHALTRARLLAARALLGDAASVDTPLDFGLPASLPTSVDATLLQPMVGAIPRPHLLCVHAASRASKRWPVSHWVQVLQLARSLGLRPLFAAGSEDEAMQAQSLLNAAGLRQPQDAAVLPRMPLARLMALMLQMQGVMGLDSGLSHLACALGKPTLLLYNTPTAWRTASFWQAGQLAIEGKGRPPTLEQVLPVYRRWLVQHVLAALPSQPSAAA